MARLTDESPMPFGKYKGTAMEDVPADYLLFIYENDRCTYPVAKYISENLDVIQKQAKEIEQKKSRHG